MPSKRAPKGFAKASTMKPQSSFFTYLEKWTHGQTYHDVFIILLIQLNVVIYAMSYWMQQPVLPFIIEKLGSNLNEGDSAGDSDGNLGSYSTAFGYFQTMVSLLQLVGGPFIGKYTDKSGAKKSLILCQIGSAFSYFFLGSSTSLQLLFISRFITILQQVMQTAQAAVAQLVDDKHREESMGRLSMAYGVGMILGSSSGGIITKYTSLQINAFAAGAISVVVVVLDIMFLPPLKASNKSSDDDETADDKTTRPERERDGESRGGIFGNFGEIVSLALRPNVRGLCLFVFFAGFGITLHRSMFSLIFKEVFKFEGWQLGFFISYAALISTLSNSFLVGYIKSKYDSDTIVQYCVIIVSLCLGIFGYGTNYQIIDIKGLCVLAIPQTIASGFLYVMINGYISRIVDKTEMGTAIALTHALRSLTGVVSPAIGGHLITYGYQSIGYFGFCSGLFSIALFKSFVQTKK